MVSKAKNLDLTEGAIWKQLLLFSLPMLAGSLFQQLYTLLDAIVVGRFVGKAGLASIDSVYNLIKLPLNAFIGLSTGATIIIAQHFGARKRAELSQAVHTAVAFALVGGVLLSVAGVVLAPAGLRLMNVSDELYPMTLTYTRIIFGGLASVLTYNMGAGILRAVGDARTPLYALVVGSAANTALDLLFVGVLGMGVTGAALTTVMGQTLSAALVLRALTRTSLDHRVSPRGIRFHRAEARPVFRLGLPIALQSSLHPVANMMIQSNINAMGTDNIAAWALCGKMDFLFWLVVDALAAATSTFVAQNYGAGHFARIRKGVKIGMGMTLVSALLISALLYFGYEPLGKLFLKSDDRRILDIVGAFMRFLAPLYPLYIFAEILSGAIRGAGETIKPMILMLIGTWAFRILWVLFVVPQNRTMLTVIGTFPASWLLTSALFIAFYARFRKTAFGPRPLPGTRAQTSATP